MKQHIVMLKQIISEEIMLLETDKKLDLGTTTTENTTNPPLAINLTACQATGITTKQEGQVGIHRSEVFNRYVAGMRDCKEQWNVKLTNLNEQKNDT
ncbi:unnamed protein product [Acanthoscelides obtectus]|uniref:Uncharacterized protein n=1 Tax=Acanthoscelides obtectus TaxID=200917 RepID=A0A9P0JZM5_ACAOB|nr:unnamed protein product [Acanthoscelides obtectus]CAK1669716.1 hypothetical protein AOBTE_LOCUS27198 [Acanthoscelides obtectus]